MRGKLSNSYSPFENKTPCHGYRKHHNTPHFLAAPLTINTASIDDQPINEKANYV
jgi:hypothetical protein